MRNFKTLATLTNDLNNATSVASPIALGRVALRQVSVLVVPVRGVGMVSMLTRSMIRK